MRSKIFVSDSTFGISNISDIVVLVKDCGEFIDFFANIKTRREQDFIFVQEQLDTKYCFMSMTEESFVKKFKVKKTDKKEKIELFECYAFKKYCYDCVRLATKKWRELSVREKGL